MIHTLAISGYRSIRDLGLPLDAPSVVTGRNGVGQGRERIPGEWPAR